MLLAGGALTGNGGKSDSFLCASGRLTMSSSDARLERRLEAGGGVGRGGGGLDRARERRFGVEDIRTQRVMGVSSLEAPSLDSAGPARGDERSGFRMRARLWRRLSTCGDGCAFALDGRAGSSPSAEDRLCWAGWVMLWRRGNELGDDGPEASIMNVWGREKEQISYKEDSASASFDRAGK
jgi:hypothetical protein